MSTSKLKEFFSSILATIKEDAQLPQKIAMVVSCLIAFYPLIIIENQLNSFFGYLKETHSTLLLGIFAAGLCGILTLFQDEATKLGEKLKKLDQNILGALCSSFLFFLFCVISIYFFGNSQLNDLNNIKNFDIAQFKLDLNEKVYIENNLVTETHLADLRKNFNSIIKTINKRNSKSNSTANDETSTENNLFLDGDIIALYSFLETTVPLFLDDTSESNANKQPSMLQDMIGLVCLASAIYLVSRALLEFHSPNLVPEFKESTPKIEELLKVNTKEPSPVVTVEAKVKSEEPMVESFNEQIEMVVDDKIVLEPVQMVVEYCLNCEKMKNEKPLENLQEDQQVSSSNKSPFKNLNRGEVTQMSYTGASSFDELKIQEDGEVVYENKGDQQYVDDEVEYIEEEVAYEVDRSSGAQMVEEENFNEQEHDATYKNESCAYGDETFDDAAYADEQIEYEQQQVSDQEALLNKQAKLESEYNRADSSLSQRILKQAQSAMNLATGEAFNDLLSWLLFNEIEIDPAFETIEDFIDLLNVLTFQEEYEDEAFEHLIRKDLCKNYIISSQTIKENLNNLS